VRKIALCLVIVMFAVGCAAQVEPASPAMQKATRALDELEQLTTGPGHLDDLTVQLHRLREALLELGALEPDVTTQQRTVQPKKSDGSTSTPPTQEELDRRQRETGKDYLSGPSLQQRAWWRQLATEFDALEQNLAAHEIDPDAAQQQLRLLRTTLSNPP